MIAAHHGLALLFTTVAIESFGVPIPGETVLITFAVLASQGRQSIVTVIVVAAAGAIVGDNLGYWVIGRRGGRTLLARSAWLERRSRHVLPRAEMLIRRYGGRAVFFGRFVSVLRETIAWVAGLVGMPWSRFLFWNAAGGFAWATAVGLLAYVGGQALADTVGKYGLFAAVALAVAALLIAAGRRFMRRSAWPSLKR